MLTKGKIDMLTGGVIVARKFVEERRRRAVTAKLRGVAERLKKFHHGMEREAEKLDKHIDAVEARAGAVLPKAHTNLDAHHEMLNGVDEYLGEIERTNSPDESETPRSTQVAAEQQKRSA